jgi:hypothetical protein
MPVKPILLKDLRRTAVHNHRINVGKDSYNRWDPLTPRARTFSAGKRPRSEDSEITQVPKTPKLDSNLIFSQLSAQDSVMKDVKVLATELEALNSNQDLPQDPRIACISKIVLGLVKSHENLTSAVFDSAKLCGSVADRDPPAGGSRGNVAQKKTPPATTPRVEISSEEIQKRKVKAAIKEAEKKTLIFNLNLGTSQMMNKESISRKVTTTLGDIVKKGKHDYNIEDAEDVIDDILSCAKLEFFGNATKKFFNKRNVNDERNDKMYTLPVRLDFKDRDTRFNAEVSLRKICKINCATPYPKKLRTMLSGLVAEGKRTHPNCFIKTRVNVDNLTIDALAKTDKGWVDLKLTKQIPLNILDNNPLVQAESQVDQVEMEDTEDEELNLS